MKRIIFALAIPALFFTSCNNGENGYDAAGTFETVEVIVSAKGNGTIEQLNITEGQELTAGEVVGYIDSTQVVLQRRQLQAMKGAVNSRQTDSDAQLAALRAQLSQAEHEQERVTRLVKADAATQKQLDDANAQINILKKQIAAQLNAINTANRALNRETIPLNVQMQSVDDQLENYRIINPVDGVVLTKYAEAAEVTGFGRPIYKIANMDEMILRAYFTGGQLASIQNGQQVTVEVDAGEGKTKQYPGTVTWISQKAEFTPKTIQTRSERENQVYAAKIAVKNDGFLRIGMYGEVFLEGNKAE